MRISCKSVWSEFFERYYEKEINNLALQKKHGEKNLVLYVDFMNIHKYHWELSEELLNNPDIVLSHAQAGLAEVPNIYNEDLVGVKVRIVNLPPTRKFLVKEVCREHIDKLIAVEGIVRRVSEPRVEIVKAAFICDECNNYFYIEPEGNKLRKPNKCPRCSSKYLRLDISKSELVDVQKIQIQDLPENLEREQPILLDVYLRDDLVGSVRPGDKVIINGIVRLDISKSSNILELKMDAISIQLLEPDVRSIEITEKDKEKIKELAKRPDIYDILVKSVAPSVYGYDDIKLAIVLQLFGGVSRKFPDGTVSRGDIHILLLGDPSTARSRIMRAVKEVAPRAVMAVGVSSSGVGLTVSVSKDKDNRWTIEAGALILADRGIALIDEIEKMRKEDREYLLEAMEQNTVTVSKAGINATLNARCSILASANPKYGRFDPYSPLVEQINLEPPLLSRFDLIFVVLDKPNENLDRNIAEHLLSNTQSKTPVIDPLTFKKYVLYARKTINDIVLSEEAKEEIIKYYIELRKRSKETGAIAITARQLEALRRLTEASAKVRLSNIATVEDARRAISLFKASLEKIAVEPETGEMDIDYVMTGMSKRKRDKLAIVRKIIIDLDVGGKGAKEEDIIEECGKYGIDSREVLDLLRKLKEAGEIYEPRRGFFRVLDFKD